MTTQKRLLLSGILIGVLYGAVARAAFGHRWVRDDVFSVMSFSFLFLVPLVLGFLAVYLGERKGPRQVPSKYRLQVCDLQGGRRVNGAVV